MKEETINKLLEKFVGYLDTTESFISVQAPDFIQQLVAFYSWEVMYDFYLAIGLVVALLISSLACIFTCTYSAKKDFHGLFVFSMIMGSLIGVMFVFSLAFIPKKYAEVKKLELAPKIFLLEKARELIK